MIQHLHRTSEHWLEEQINVTSSTVVVLRNRSRGTFGLGTVEPLVYSQKQR